MSVIFDFLKDYYGTIIAVSSGLFSLYVICKRWIKNAIRTIRLGNSFHNIFGNSPANAIREIHDAIKKSHNTLEIRQSISERCIKIGIFLCDHPTGKCIWTNQYLNDLFGLDSVEMKGDKGFGWMSAIEDDKERMRVHQVWMYAVTNNIPYECEYTITNQRSNEKIKVTAYAIAVIDNDNNTLCHVGYITTNSANNIL